MLVVFSWRVSSFFLYQSDCNRLAVAEEPRMEVLRQSSRRYRQFFCLFVFCFVLICRCVLAGLCRLSVSGGRWSLLTCSLLTFGGSGARMPIRRWKKTSAKDSSTSFCYSWQFCYTLCDAVNSYSNFVVFSSLSPVTSYVAVGRKYWRAVNRS